jgi:hypothetical protein
VHLGHTDRLIRDRGFAWENANGEAVIDRRGSRPAFSFRRCGNSGQKSDHIDRHANHRLAIRAGAKHELTGRHWRDRSDYWWSTQLGRSGWLAVVVGAAIG